MINKTTYDYPVFYYDVNQVAAKSILKSLYMKRLSKDKGAEESLSQEESDVIAIYMKEAADDVAEQVARWFRDLPLMADNVTYVAGYEYGKLNIDPEVSTSGDYIIYRIAFSENHYNEEMLQKIDSAMDNYITAYIREAWSLGTNSEQYQAVKVQYDKATARLDSALSFRTVAPTRRYTFY